MLAPQTAFQAYRSDLERLDCREEIGSADTAWLLITHCLSRLAAAGAEVRAELGEQCAASLSDLLETSAEIDLEMRGHDRDLRLLVVGFGTIGTEAGSNAASRAVRGFAARMAEAGAFAVAFTALSYARAACAQATDGERGLLAADQARIARQLGELDVAEELYLTVAVIADRSADESLAARALLGRGVLARVRGNYPKAGMLFNEGLRKAIACRSSDMQYLAHQGLLVVAGVTGDFDAGIEHGWAAFQLADGDASREAESLSNLAQLCLDAGYPGAALRTFLSTLARSSTLRIRLGSLGGAALAAGRLNDTVRLKRLADEAIETIARSALPFENVAALRSLAAAYQAAGDQFSAERHRLEALRIAKARGFHEFEIVCERMEIARTAEQPTVRALEAENRVVVTRLEVFEPESDERAFALTRSD